MTAIIKAEDYRIVAIGHSFNANDLTGKSPDDQIRLLLQRRLDNLNAQMAKEQEEKRRLEQGLKK